MRHLTPAALAALLACAGSSPSDQPASVSPVGERRIVFEHTFTIPSQERVRVDLAAGTYRMDVSLAGPVIRVVPFRSGVQPPTIRDAVGAWDVIVHVTETYEVTALGGRAGQSTTVRIRTHEPDGGGE
jgi:hypothetical protein